MFGSATEFAPLDIASMPEVSTFELDKKPYEKAFLVFLFGSSSVFTGKANH
jgi:hypothetical protein